MNYTILHISDIHKGEGADLNNLYESLIQDCDNYTSAGITKPSIIVVSGDIVNGAEGANAIAEIRQQYNEATLFLTKLVNYFLNGDKSRIIIVPGNHDMCREYSKSSMTPSKSDKADDVKQMWKMRSDLRWSWHDFMFHEITTTATYDNRFSHYVEFYNGFYEGKRKISDIPDRFSDIVDLPEFGISFALFNSCYGLDHLNYSGAICPSAVTNLRHELNTLYKNGRLLVAVWHHHTMGLPPETNYLDYRILQAMLANHIHMGLYGHQHRSQVITKYSDIDEEQSMLLVCSGSLYGQRKELATGCPRQYNLINVEINEGLAKLSINVRNDSQPDYEIPNWTLGTIGRRGQQAYLIEVSLYSPSKSELLMGIDEEARTSGDYDTAVRKIIALGKDTPNYNAYLDEYLTKSHIPNDEIIDILVEPDSETQSLFLLEAAKNSNNPEIRNKIKSNLYINLSTSSIVKDLLSEL